MILQVDRVSSVEEALAFRDAGVNLIGVALDPDPRFEDTRFVSFETAKAIQTAIAPARLVGHVPTYFFDETPPQACDRVRRVLGLQPSFIQFYRGGLLDELVPTVLNSGVPIIRDGAGIDIDDGSFIELGDPAAFVRVQFEGDPAGLKPVLFHLDVVPNTTDPWLFLTGVALDWPEECPQVADIAATTRDRPFLLSIMGVSADTIGPYTATFPDAHGFFARLGPDEAGGAPCSKPESLLAALKALRLHQ